MARLLKWISEVLLKKTGEWLNTKENKGLLYFAQRMDELTYPYTLDSYRSPTTNAPFLIAECMSVLEDHKEHDVNPAHIDRIWGELKDRMSGNAVAKDLLRVSWNEYEKVDIKNFSALSSTLRVLAAELQPIRYLKHCFATLKVTPPNHLDTIEFLAREITTTTVNCGIDVSFISKAIEDHFFGDTPGDPDEVLESLLSDLLPKIRKYDVYLAIKTDAINIKSDIREIFSIDFLRENPENAHVNLDNLQLSAGEIVARMKGITSPDPFSALSTAKKNVARLHDLYGLFYHKGSYKIGSYALVGMQGDDDRSLPKFRANLNHMEFIRDNRRGHADRKLESLIKAVKLPTGEDAEKFFRVVDFHGMSLGSQIPENQLINLWTSLETIAPSQKGKSIIGSVVDGIVPFIGLQYYTRIFTALMRDLKRWNKDELKTAFGVAGFDQKTSTLEKVFKLTVLPENDAICTSMLLKMDNFPLLRKRVYDINVRSKTGKNLADGLTSHQRRVEQQIFRIYRARNSIVHSAGDASTIGNLIVSAHDYFDQVFSLSSEMCSRPYGFSNYTDCFNFCAAAYDQYKAEISQKKDVAGTDFSSIIWNFSSK